MKCRFCQSLLTRVEGRGKVSIRLQILSQLLKEVPIVKNHSINQSLLPQPSYSPLSVFPAGHRWRILAS
jgi:hypothetical protein